jgi:hypothetical protein
MNMHITVIAILTGMIYSIFNVAISATQAIKGGMKW